MSWMTRLMSNYSNDTRMLCITIAAFTAVCVTMFMGIGGYFWTLGSANGALDRVAQQ